MSTRAAVSAARSPGDAVFTEGVVEGGLLVGRLAALADDQRAGELESAGRELPWTAARDHDGPLRHLAFESDGFGAADIDDRDGGVDDHALAGHGALAHPGAFSADAARAVKD